jgi:hypothetical protein
MEKVHPGHEICGSHSGTAEDLKLLMYDVTTDKQLSVGTALSMSIHYVASAFCL